MRSAVPFRFAVFVTLALGLAGCGDGCGNRPYFLDGAGPDVSDIDPSFENGNVGGALAISLLADEDDPTDEELETLITPRLVRLNGDFSACADADADGDGTPNADDADSTPRQVQVEKEVRVVVGNRNATVWSSNDDAVDVLTPVGPIRGGLVDVQVACRGLDEDGNLIDGVTFLEGAYDYYLGRLTIDGEIPDDEDVKRMEPLFENEFGSFTMFYQAQPFGSLPDATGYGYFFSEQSPRSSMFWGQNPDMVYGGAPSDFEEPLPLLPQIPQLNYETPEQGDRLEAGDAITFFHRRAYNDPLNPVRIKARKKIDPGTGAVQTHTTQTPNNDAVWLKLVIDGPGGAPQDRYLRLGQQFGQWCLTPDNAGCTDDEGDNEFLDRTRIHVDPGLTVMTPQKPTREHLEENYPTAIPEYLAYLDCNGDAACESEVGIMLPSGDYEVEVVKTVDEEGQWPWQEDEGFQGLRVTMERATVHIEQGTNYVDFPANVTARWPFDEDQGRYDNFDFPVGEGGLPAGKPIYVSYPGGFSQGERVPPKNYDADEDPPFSFPPEGPADLRVINDADADEADIQAELDNYNTYPYIEIPEIEIDTMLFAGGGAFATAGFPLRIDLDPELDPNEPNTIFDWRLPLPGGGVSGAEDMTDGGRWADTYFVLSLTIRQIEGPGGFGGGPWKVSAFAWPGDDFIVIPRESLATLPRIADAFRPDGEDQIGTEYLGFASLEIHRLARWNLSTPEQLENGVGFRSEDANVMFDVNVISIGYFHTENSCVDGLDNDGDGQVDAADTNCARNDADEPYETGQCQDGEDNDEDGLIDAEDEDCLDGNGVYDPTDIDEGSACSDGVDNDGDGWTDFKDVDNDGIPDAGSDPGCESADDSTEGGFDSRFDCNDGIDSDFDGLIDSDDPGCESGNDESEAGDTCSDGIDNNGDGWIDWEDIMCRPGRNSDAAAFLLGIRGEVEYSWIDALDFECSDSTPGGAALADNDGDELINADDPECAFGWDDSGESSLPAECSDRIDNDGDGWIDWPNPNLPGGGADPDCISLNHPEGGNIQGGTCNDGLDNDGDGWIDADDPVCRSGAENETVVAGTLQYSTLACNNNVDDDEDGDVDADDPECVSGKDNSEAE